MMTGLPAPLVPADCDLRDFHFLPVEIARLFGSDFHSHSNDAEWRAGVTLWLKSYHQVPAASMPDDDISLARSAEFGVQVKAWKKVREGALHGWVKCSDGRLYHPVVAEKALEAWLDKLNARKSGAAGNAKRHNVEFDSAPFDEAIAATEQMLRSLNPNSRKLKSTGSRAKPAADAIGPLPANRRDMVATLAENPPDCSGSRSQENRREGKGTEDTSLRSEEDDAPPELCVEKANGKHHQETPEQQALASAYAAYNETAARVGWPKVQKQTSKRDKALGARLRDAGGIEGWLAALEKAERSDFCCGRAPPRSEGDRPFLADLDFLVQETSFVRLMEGRYDNRIGTARSTRDDAILEGARRAAQRAH